MKRTIPLSPTQSMAYAMGRGLLLLDRWASLTARPIDAERAMLVDFSLQYPRVLVPIMPEIVPILRAHDLGKQDLSDLFAQHHFDTMRERFLTVASCLVARNLVDEISEGTTQRDALLLKITPLGTNVAHRFTNSVSIAYRAISDLVCGAWQIRNLETLAADLRKALRDEPLLRAKLREPLAPWMAHAEGERDE